jgi:hypothetical protein
MRGAYQRVATALSLVVVGVVLGGCPTTNLPSPAEPMAPAGLPLLAPSFPPQELVGRWGFASYHRPDDRTRTETAARNGCKQPYVIGAGPTGGVIMHLADQAQPQELKVKGAPGGKNFIGPGEDPPGGMQDREVVLFDGRVLITKWIDPEIAGRYGNGIYVRCAPRA